MRSVPVRYTLKVTIYLEKRVEQSGKQDKC